jgi:hypothetical protein
MDAELKQEFLDKKAEMENAVFAFYHLKIAELKEFIKEKKMNISLNEDPKNHIVIDWWLNGGIVSEPTIVTIGDNNIDDYFRERNNNDGNDLAEKAIKKALINGIR